MQTQRKGPNKKNASGIGPFRHVSRKGCVYVVGESEQLTISNVAANAKFHPSMPVGYVWDAIAGM